MEAPKRKVSLTLDADLVAEFEKDGPLSSEINEALRVEFERRRNFKALQELNVEMAEKYGPLDTPEDLAAIERYIQMLS